MKYKRISKILFFSFFLIYLAASIYLAFVLKIYHNDAVSRTANAFFTVFGRNPHLGAIGFVWQPLPSLLQIPFLLIFKPLGLEMLSGPLVTSLLGALSVVTIYEISKLDGKKSHSALSILLALFYGLNPMILLYVAIGSSETIFISSLLFYSYFFLRWFYKSRQFDILLSGFFLATAFGSRYESIPVFLAGILSIILVEFYRKNSYSKIEATIIQFSLPFVYTVAIWILANWLIKGDAFYFMNSVYSNSGFTENLKLNPMLMENSFHSILGSIIYTLKRVVILAPILILIPFLFMEFRKRKNAINDIILFVFLVAPYASILAFHTYELYKGDSFGWLRFDMYAIIAGVLMTVYFLKKQKSMVYPAFLLLLLGTFSTLYAMSLPAFGKEEVSFYNKITNPATPLDYSRSYADQQSVSSFIKNTRGQILVDTDKGFAIPLFSDDPKRYVITSDIDYEKVIKNYPEYVSWIIVEKPSIEETKLNKIYQYYPNIWTGNAPQLTMYKQIDDWRIFKVEPKQKTVVTSQ